MRPRKIKKLVYSATAIVIVYNFIRVMTWSEDIHYDEGIRNRFRLEQRNAVVDIDDAESIDETFTKEGYPIKFVHGKEVDKRSGDYSNVTLPRFVESGDQWSPGEDGNPFQFEMLDPQENKKRRKAIRAQLFDVMVSDIISVHRSVPDLRSERCQREQHVNAPTSSVIIVFHNEAWTTLIRSVHSVLDRTPAHLLAEIILVDDASTMDYLKLPLEKYLKTLKKVRLIRATRRLGMVQGRNLGYLYAKKEIVIFMDSHVECLPGWYEPLVVPFLSDIKIVTVPVLDTIDPYTFAVLKQSEQHVVGGVHLHSLTFAWMERKRANSSTDLRIESPTLPGSVFAVSKEWFSQLGMFDPYLQTWGGETIEISFKTWMCGGRILISTCSHVAHLHLEPANVSTQKTLLNSVRVAEVWMDDYKQYLHEKTAFQQTQHKNIQSRHELRKSLQCRNFYWYLNKVNPELFREIDEYSFYLGQIRNKALDLCLNAQHTHTAPNLLQCSNSFSQVWMLRTDGRLSCYGSMLIGHYGSDDALRLITVPDTSFGVYDSDQNHLWEYDMHKRLFHKSSGLCLGVTNQPEPNLQLTDCTASTGEVTWSFSSRKEFYRQHHQDMPAETHDET